MVGWRWPGCLPRSGRCKVQRWVSFDESMDVRWESGGAAAGSPSPALRGGDPDPLPVRARAGQFEGPAGAVALIEPDHLGIGHDGAGFGVLLRQVSREDQRRARDRPEAEQRPGLVGRALPIVLPEAAISGDRAGSVLPRDRASLLEGGEGD